MEIMDLINLYSYDYNLNKIAVYHVQSPEGKTSYTLSENGRVNQGFVFVCSNYFIYSPVKSEKIQVSTGEILYLPKYARYSHKAYLDDNNGNIAETIVVNFNISDNNGEEILLSENIFKITPKDKLAYKLLFESLSASFAIHMYSISKVKSLLYSLFAELCKEFKYDKNNPSMKEFMSIRNAIQYIEQNSISHIKIKDLSKMSYMSVNSFRKRFKEYSGMLPFEYIQMLKMEKAKFCLKEQMLTVWETANYLNFSDAAYFCKVFKKYTGVTPGQYR